TSQAPARASLPPLQRESAEDEYRRARREAKARTTAQARSSRPPPGSPNAQPRDLFARHSRAGSEEEEQLEQPEPAPYAAPDADGPRLTGARNESSVLFSLDSLLKQEKKSSAPPPPRAPYRDEALLTDNGPLMGGGIAPALAAPDFNAPITAPPPRFSTAAPVFAEDEMPFARPRSSRAWLYVLVLLAFGGAGALGWKMGALRPLLSKLGGSPPTVASDTATPASAPRVTESASAKPEAAPSATASAAASASVAASASATATTTATAPGKQAPAATPPPARAASTPVARSTSASSSGTSHKESAESGDDAPAEKEAPSKETASAAKEAPASGGASTPFDTAAAKEALAGATGNVASCKEMGGPTGNGRVSITFAPSGRPTSVAVTGDLAGTTVGSCIARLYRAVRVPAFAGDPVTVAKGFAVQ
ncbi:MAG TPA: hypothetical protein VGQ57_07595, partial [Polyangiaceae bacterium]|nr:hypothetical protein [Polyangiaceae bacterium]